MDENRQVRQVVTGHATQDGAGVKLTRVLGNETVEDFDPFLMLDAFDSTNPDDYTRGFPWHPHRGIETVTYLISGDIEHADSMGHGGSILDGDCQWMTAGSGIIHQEMPKAAKRMQGAQLWINLPARHKMTKPAYNSITAASIPRVDEHGALVKIIAGLYNGKQGAFRGEYVDATYLDVALQPGAEWTFDTVPSNTLFAYIYDGSGCFSQPFTEQFESRRALLFTHGEKLFVKAGENGLKFLLLTAPPLLEPVAWGGPIVMNTRDELAAAFHELDEGTFIKDQT